MMVPRAAVCAERIVEVLDTSTSVAPPDRPVTAAARATGCWCSTGSGSAIPGADAPVLRDISFVARPGTTTAVVGSTGAGKTTLMSLVPRLFDATAGAVRVDGVDVRELDPHELVGAGSARCRSGRTCSPAPSREPALRQAGRDGRRAVGGAGGRAGRATSCGRCPTGWTRRSRRAARNVSGGQRQRLAIARALVRRPEIYLFDDSFSALDVATDARLRAALAPGHGRRHRRDRRPADRDDQERGPDRRPRRGRGRRHRHARRAAGDCPTYAEIVESQLAAAEAA